MGVILFLRLFWKYIILSAAGLEGKGISQPVLQLEWTGMTSPGLYKLAVCPSAQCLTSDPLPSEEKCR